ncbi:Arginine N-methyltransferase 2 [Vanrija albida]|uniref:Arginine N-methyltransferase 2 n=1 Tax=Vanrija albida TaxID=181172 RepID=A0ABR3PX07_9TREE
MSAPDADLPAEALELAQALLHASSTEPAFTIAALLERHAPTWYQDEDLGFSCLHYAAERREPAIVRQLLRAGAVWNAVDHWGRTAGEVALSLGDRESWEAIRNEGVRSEMLHHALKGDAGNGVVTLRAQDDSSAGDNLAFLASELTWETGADGRERVLDADGNGVMMGWEEPLMREHVRLMTADHPKANGANGGMSILNVGYGLGIVDRLFQSTSPASHTIIEAHPQVLKHIRDTGVDKIPGVRILEGRWQDWVVGDKLGELIAGTEDAMGFDAIFVDTFAEGYEDLKAFFEVLPDILEAEAGVFSFWNGLGATNPTIYAVSSSLAELHLDDVGLDTTWHDVAIPESLAREVWKGVRRRYWELPGYKLPVSKMRLM